MSETGFNSADYTQVIGCGVYYIASICSYTLRESSGQNLLWRQLHVQNRGGAVSVGYMSLLVNLLYEFRPEKTKIVVCYADTFHSAPTSRGI